MVTLVLNAHLADNGREKVDNFPRSRYESGLEVIYMATPNCKRIWKFWSNCIPRKKRKQIC